MAQQETTADAAMKRRTVSTHRQQQQAAKQHRPPAASAPPRFLLPAGAGTAFRNAAAGRRVTNNGFCNLHEISFVPVECARTDAVMLFPMQYNGCVNSKTLNQLCSKTSTEIKFEYKLSSCQIEALSLLAEGSLLTCLCAVLQ
eukprot:247735-Rhodomonas_salina.1